MESAEEQFSPEDLSEIAREIGLNVGESEVVERLEECIQGRLGVLSIHYSEEAINRMKGIVEEYAGANGIRI